MPVGRDGLDPDLLHGDRVAELHAKDIQVEQALDVVVQDDANAVGRLPVVATLEELDEEALVKILTEPRNALTKQYEKLFDMEGSEVEFRDDALRAVARKAMERKTGARGLRTILEQVLLDTMYDLPSMENVRKVVIDENVIIGDAEPYMIFDAPEAIAASE